MESDKEGRERPARGRREDEERDSLSKGKKKGGAELAARARSRAVRGTPIVRGGTSGRQVYPASLQAVVAADLAVGRVRC